MRVFRGVDGILKKRNRLGKFSWKEYEFLRSDEIFGWTMKGKKEDKFI
jgi:hypothetical protein